jgi:hypothetical protein
MGGEAGVGRDRAGAGARWGRARWSAGRRVKPAPTVEHESVHLVVWVLPHLLGDGHLRVACEVMHDEEAAEHVGETEAGDRWLVLRRREDGGDAPAGWGSGRARRVGEWRTDWLGRPKRAPYWGSRFQRCACAMSEASAYRGVQPDPALAHADGDLPPVVGCVLPTCVSD